MRNYLAVIFVLTLFLVPWFAVNYPDQMEAVATAIGNAGVQLASVFYTHNAVTVSALHSDYVAAGQNTSAAKKVRILLVPGHEPDYGGAEFGALKERNMTVELAQDLQQILANNNRYQVMVTRNTQSWNPTFADYFKNDWNEIAAWEQAHKDEIANLTRLGQFHPVTPEVYHNNAPTDVAMRIYGIDKWVNENNIDIVIHIHFNDYPGHASGVPGQYNGLAIYVPQQEYANSSTTEVLADGIFKRLAKYSAVSNLPGESSGIVEDQDLIAIGAYNSVNAASMLIEYGYIYEPQFVNPATRSSAIKDLAFQTYVGLQDFFEPDNVVNVAGAYDTLLVPHQWSAPLTATNAAPADVLALQTALTMDGDYPPANKSKNDCPRSGSLGPCTKTALNRFQAKYGITGEKDMAGQKTINLLEKMYAVKVN
jgi:N-acetylmuramoyl-L-alanine amidase